MIHYNKKISYDQSWGERFFVDHFLRRYNAGRQPGQIILDLDATDDPLHGKQEGRFFHGFYNCYCYLPLYIFCDDYLLAARLRSSDIDAAQGADEELERIVRNSLRKISTQMELSSDIDDLQCFSPAYPEPPHMIRDVIQ